MKSGKRFIASIGILAVLWATLLAGCRGGATEPSPTDQVDGSATEPVGVQARTFEALWQAVNENYVHHSLVEDEWQAAYEQHRPQIDGASPEAFQEAVEALMGTLPEGAAVWQSRQERIERERQDSPSYEGIGAFIAYRDAPEPHIILLSVVPGSPAEAAGLKAHDSISVIDGVAVQAQEGVQAVERIRGPAGSRVTLTVQSPGEASRQVEVERQSLVATGEMKSAHFDEQGLGYILFPPGSYEGMIDDFLSHFQAMTGDGSTPLNGLILDLRTASSGDSWPLEEMTALFTDGILGEFLTAAGNQEIQVEGQDFFGSQTVPLVILVGPDTQGRSEIFAAIIQGIGRGTVVGLPTEGAVEGSREFPLPDGSVVIISTVSFASPDGRDIGLTGIEPDIAVEADWDEVSEEEDEVLDEALESLSAPGSSTRTEGVLQHEESILR